MRNKAAVADQSVRLRDLAGDVHRHGVRQYHGGPGGRRRTDLPAGGRADPAGGARPPSRPCRRHRDLLPSALANDHDDHGRRRCDTARRRRLQVCTL